MAQLVTRPYRTVRSGGERDTLEHMFVYIIKSIKDGSEYVGMSDNPDRRLTEHNYGEVKSTKAKRPWKKVYVEELSNRVDARKREKYLKSAAGRRFRKSIRAISSVG